MSSLLTLPLLWAQAAAATSVADEIPPLIRRTLFWFFLYGEPSFTLPGLLGGWLTWIKAIGLLCLVGWLGSWLVTAIKERAVGNGRGDGYVGIAGLILTPVTVLVRVLETMKVMPTRSIGNMPIVALLGLLCAFLFLTWVEVGIWRTIRRYGRYPDILVLLGIHVALLLGIFVGLTM